MEVLDILQKNGAELYPEDLAFFEAELDTGEYSPAYIEECRERIREIRLRKRETAARADGDPGIPGNAFALRSQLAPGAQGEPLTEQERLMQIARDLGRMRTASNYKTRFKQYLADRPDMDEEFIDKNIALFLPWELDEILMTRNFSEAFLEKYFSSLDAEKIARCQLFSEKFFIRHFSQLDAAIVLTKGKNEWRKKGKRSAQLDVFLRLKGVKI